MLGVEDLLQKHSLVEADIAAQADRVKAVNEQAEMFLHMDNEEDGKCLTYGSEKFLVYYLSNIKYGEAKFKI